MIDSIRKCNGCNYQTLILSDDKGERSCKHCGGLLKIIGQTKEDKMKCQGEYCNEEAILKVRRFKDSYFYCCSKCAEGFRVKDIEGNTR
ncbi:unnamed protein product, partial [marine sediment metagenome]